MRLDTIRGIALSVLVATAIWVAFLGLAWLGWRVLVRYG
jgi:hypothetical protein